MVSDLLQKFLSEFLQKAVFPGCSFTVAENKVEKTKTVNYRKWMIHQFKMPFDTRLVLLFELSYSTLKYNKGFN